ncbi:MAG: RNA polymerase sigma factor [Desulfobacterales bacterium]|nr:RNA polymerase sigma factor [Desulfobacterales bacterium]
MTCFSEKEAYDFFERHYSRVRAFIRSIVQQDWIAEDLTQETFIRAFRHLPALKDQTRAKPWLFRIARNLCVDYFRQGKSGVEKDASPLDDALIPSASSQERLLEQQEMTTCVQNHFQLLPETLRTVIWLFDAEGFTHREIAEILGIDVPNVKVRLHRARKKMMKILNDNCRFERDDRNVFVCVPSKDGDPYDLSRQIPDIRPKAKD